MNNSQSSSYGKASLVCGIVSMLVLPFIFGLIAIILGIVAVSKPTDNNSNQNTSPIIGIALGICGILYAFYSTGQF